MHLTYERLVDVERDLAIFPNVVVPAEVRLAEDICAVISLEEVAFARPQNEPIAALGWVPLCIILQMKSFLVKCRYGLNRIGI